MSEQEKPEERLKLLRARAQDLLAELNNDFARSPLSDKVTAKDEPPDNMLQPDHLSLFLRSLSSRLNSAIDEVRASSHDLEDLTSEVRNVEELLGKGN